jgi:hypothetical protein
MGAIKKRGLMRIRWLFVFLIMIVAGFEEFIL